MAKDLSYKVVAAKGAKDPFAARDYQAEFLHAMQNHTKAKPFRGLAVWPRRAGKDLTALHGTLVMAHEEIGMYWHCLPVYEQARKACWEAFVNTTGQRLMDNVFPREIRRKPDEFSPRAEMVVELRNGSIVRFVGSDSIDRLVGSGPRGVTFSEFSLAKPSSWPLVRPILRENRGWATFLFTPRGHNHGYKLFMKARERPDTWFSSYHDLYTLGLFTKKEVDAILNEERADGMPEELVRQEYLCDFSAANVGSYYGDLIERLELRGALEPFEYERDGIFYFFDLGISDSFAIWAARIHDSGVDVVNHYEASSKPLSHYFNKLEEWEDTLGYKPVAFYLPHDAKARSLQTGISVVEQYVTWAKGRYGAEKGLGMVKMTPEVSVQDGIEAARWVLQQEHTRIHPNCNKHEGIEALRSYHRAWDEDSRAFGKHPEHDWSSHSADAFRYLAVSLRLAKLIRPKPKSRIVLPRSPRIGITMDELLRLHDMNRPRKYRV